MPPVPTMVVHGLRNSSNETNAFSKKQQFGTVDLVMKFLPFPEWLKFSEDVLSLEPTLIKQYQEKFEKCVADLKEEMMKICKEQDQLLAMYYSKQKTKLQTIENRTETTDNKLKQVDSNDIYFNILPSYFKDFQNPYVHEHRSVTKENPEIQEVTASQNEGRNGQDFSESNSAIQPYIKDNDAASTHTGREENKLIQEEAGSQIDDGGDSVASQGDNEYWKAMEKESTTRTTQEQHKLTEGSVDKVKIELDETIITGKREQISGQEDHGIILAHHAVEMKSDICRGAEIEMEKLQIVPYHHIFSTHTGREENKLIQEETSSQIDDGGESGDNECWKAMEKESPQAEQHKLTEGSVDKEKIEVDETIITSKQDSGTQTNYDSEEALEVQKEITCDGGELEIDECKVSIPENAVDEPIMVTISLNFDVSKWPEGQTAVSPMLCCLSSGTTTFKRPIKMELSTWLCSGANSEVSIMNYSKKRDPKWQEITKAFPNEEGKIVFEVDHFCKYVAAIAKDNFNTDFRISAFLFHKDDKHFVSVFCCKSKSLEKKLARVFLEYQKSLPMINEIKAQRGDKISFHLKAKDQPDLLEFEEGEQSVKVDELLFIEKFVGYFTPKEEVEQQKIKLLYTIRLNDDDHKPYNVPVHWPLSKQNKQSGDTLIYKPSVNRDLHSGSKDYSVVK